MIGGRILTAEEREFRENARLANRMIEATVFSEAGDRFAEWSEQRPSPAPKAVARCTDCGTEFLYSPGAYSHQKTTGHFVVAL